jgi:hypothetical protein
VSDSASDASSTCSQAYHGDSHPDGGACISNVARLGAIDLCGSSIANAGGVILDMRSRFNVCYVDAIAADPTAAGAITLIVSIGPSGAVTRVQSFRQPSLPLSLGDCVIGAVQEGKFDSSATGAGLEVLLSFGCRTTDDAGSAASGQ